MHALYVRRDYIRQQITACRERGLNDLADEWVDDQGKTELAIAEFRAALWEGK